MAEENAGTEVKTEAAFDEFVPKVIKYDIARVAVREPDGKKTIYTIGDNCEWILDCTYSYFIVVGEIAHIYQKTYCDVMLLLQPRFKKQLAKTLARRKEAAEKAAAKLAAKAAVKVVKK